MLSNPGNCLSTCFHGTGALDDLQEAIRLGEEAVAATPAGHPDRPGRLNNLGSHLSSRFGRTGELEELQEAIRLCEEAVATAPVDHPHRATMLANLGNHLSTRFDRTGALEDLQEAIRRIEEAVAATPVDHPDRAGRLNNLGNLLSIRFGQTGALEDLQEAIFRCEEAVAATPVDHPDRAGRLNNLGNRLSIRFDRTGALEDLQEAIFRCEDAVAATPMGHTHRATMLANLGNHLSTRFDRAGALEDLPEAIRLGEESVAATPVGHPDRSGRLDNLGNHLSARFDRAGALDDLQEAIRLGEEAVAAVPVGHPDRAGTLNNPGYRLSIRFDRTGALEDLQEAIRIGKEAVAATPVDHPGRATMLGNLGAHLSTRFDRTGALEDLQGGIRRSEEAVAATPVDHSDRAWKLNNLGNRLSIRFDRTGALGDLQEAIRRCVEAVAATPVDHPDRAKWLDNLGNRLSALFYRSRNMEHYERACTAWEMAAKYSIAHPVVCASCAHSATLALIQLGRLQEAFRNSQSAIKHLHRASSREIGREDQEYILGKVSGTSSLAASLALETGEPASTALELLEFGCGIIAGYTFDARNDVSELGEKYPALCTRYKALQDELSSPLQIPEMECHIIPSMTSTGNRVTRRIEAVRELDELEAEIRRKDGFSRFQLPPSSADFITLARSIGGPIVALSVSVHRSDAIIVTQIEIKALPLPGLDYNTLLEKSGILSSGVMKGPKRTMPDRLNTLNGVLLWLWEVAVEPVLQELNFIQDVSKRHLEPLPRIWWISSGCMGMMPIHAAGNYARDPKIITSSYVISSYTPTIKSLAYARRKASEVPGHLGYNVLIIGNSLGTSRTPSKGVLTEVRPETKAIEKIVKGAIGATYESIHIASGFQLAGFPHVVGTLWEANDLKSREVATEFYKNLFDSLDSGRGFSDGIVSEALHKAIASLRKEFEDNPIIWGPFIHLGA